MVAVIVAMTATTAALVGAPAPVGAAACSSSSGVSVVIDFGARGGGMQAVCVPGGADRPADEVVTSAGFGLTWVTRQPGFVCRVDGVPAEDPCVNTPPTTAYWGLFWSDGKDGTWHYSDFGIGGLQVPGGGYIGLAWQSGTRREPGQAATVHPIATPTPTAAPTATSPSPSVPTPSGSATGTKQPSKTPTKNTSTTAPTRTPTSTGSTTPLVSTSTSSSDPRESPTTGSSSAAPSEPPTSSATDSPTASITVEPNDSATTKTSTPSDAAEPSEPRVAGEDSSRVPTWLSVSILGLLLVSIGISTVAARRRTRR